MGTEAKTMSGGHPEEAERLLRGKSIIEECDEFHRETEDFLDGVSLGRVQQLRRVYRVAEECESLITMIEKQYVEWTPESIIDCLQHIVRVAKGEDQ